METPEPCVKSVKVNNKDIAAKSLESSWDFIVNFEQILHIVLVFPLMSLNKYIPAGDLQNLLGGL